MQISLSVPSTPQTAETGVGCDALFEEVTQAAEGQDDGDFVESFDALIQAALAAIGGAVSSTNPPALPTAVETVPTSETPPDDIGSIHQSGGTEIPGGTAAASTTVSHEAIAVGDSVGADVPQTSASPANPAEVQAPRQPGSDGVILEDSLNHPIADLPVDPTRPDQVVEDGGPSDDVMNVVEGAMESFTPIPASVLALMRADAVTTSASKGSIVPTGPKGEQPLVKADRSPTGLPADEFATSEDDLLALIPAVEFVAARGTETDRFSNAFGAFAEDRSEPAPLEAPATAPEQPIQTPIPVPASSAPPGGHERLPVVPATRDAIGAFAIEQIVTRANARDDEPVSRIEARIDPPELGRMSIEISRTSEGLSAHLTVDDPSVLALLDQQMREVQQTLEAAGVPMTSLTMSAGSERDAPQQDAHRDDEERNLASPARPNRPAGARSTATGRREIDTTA